MKIKKQFEVQLKNTGVYFFLFISLIPCFLTYNVLNGSFLYSWLNQPVIVFLIMILFGQIF